MGTINTGRVILGGLAAGLLINLSEFVLNGLVLEKDWQQAMAALNKPTEVTGGQIAMYNVMGFGLGLSLVWLYAAIRPRLGAGPKTGVLAGLFLWLTAYVLASIPWIVNDLAPMRLMVISLAWGLVELVIAGVIGASLYKETDA